jgi:cobalt-precorrin 5A hydrolase
LGIPVVAEAAALLANGASTSALVLEKQKYRGADGKHVTLSMAVWRR